MSINFSFKAEELKRYKEKLDHIKNSDVMRDQEGKKYKSWSDFIRDIINRVYESALKLEKEAEFSGIKFSLEGLDEWKQKQNGEKVDVESD